MLNHPNVQYAISTIILSICLCYDSAAVVAFVPYNYCWNQPGTTNGCSVDTGNSDFYRQQQQLQQIQQQIRKQQRQDRIIKLYMSAKGRNKQIVMGQVGIRCRYCAVLPPKNRSRGAMYYPTKLHLIYQAAQNMASIHLNGGKCPNIPQSVVDELFLHRKDKSVVGGGKRYWDEAAATVGVCEVDDCLRFKVSKKDRL